MDGLTEGYWIRAVAVVALAANSVAPGSHAGASARWAALLERVRAREAAAVRVSAVG